MDSKKNSGGRVVVILFFAVPATFLGSYAWYLYPESMWMPLAITAGVWSSFGVLALYLVSRSHPRAAEEEANQARLQPLFENRDQLVVETQTQLADTDKTFLKKSRFRTMRTMMILAVIFAGIAVFTSYWVLVGCAILVWIIFLNERWTRTMLNTNRKTVLAGIVTERLTERNSDEKSSRYYLVVGDRKTKVEYVLFERYIVGDIVELHYVGKMADGKMTTSAALITQDRKMTPEEFAQLKRRTSVPA